MSAPSDLELRRLERERTILDLCAKAMSRSAWECRGVDRRDLSRIVGRAQRALCHAVHQLDEQIQVAQMRRRRQLAMGGDR